VSQRNVVCIRNAAWAIVWDEAAARHVYRRNVDIAFEGDRISYIGPRYPGVPETAVDGAHTLVMPGMINIHVHSSSEPAFRGVREDHGVEAMHMSGMYERVGAFRVDAAGRLAASEVAYVELLRSGVTTCIDLCPRYDGWKELASRSGMRFFLGPAYSSARWRVTRDRKLEYEWDRDSEFQNFEAASRFIESLPSDPSRRLRGILYPAQIDTCSEDILRATVDRADELRVPITTHAAQSVNEFNEMLVRTGKTPIQFADSIGLLRAGTIVAHAIFLDHNSWTARNDPTDLTTLAESGASVAHCPSPFARYGQGLEHFALYRDKGINVGIGTDVAPHNILEEMRLASLLGRITSRSVHSVSSADVLHAATVAGAAAVQDSEIGRLSTGSKADIVLVDLDHPLMQPIRDPLRGLLYGAADRAVRDVFVDGRLIMQSGKPLFLDFESAAAELRLAQERMLAGAPKLDFLSRTADEIVPLSLPVVH
jgi:cytosine/adenosine deaminase-related metal-dependent hydrolase